MTEHAAPEQVRKFAPKRKPEADPTDRAGEALLAMLKEGAKLSHEKHERLMDLTHDLSRQLQAAQERIDALQDEVAHFRARAAGAEKWLEVIEKQIGRRAVLNGAALALVGATLGARECRAQQVPNSTGSEQPMLKAPANACDCHMHIYDAERFAPLRPGSRLQTNAGVKEYQLLQKRIGTTRVVIVTPAVYVTDNRVTLGAQARG